MQSELGMRFNMAHSFVVDALAENEGGPGNEPSVGMVAEQLGVDPSRASRMVADAIRGGYVRRVASQVDGRRTGLELTGAGRKLLKTTSSFRRRVFSKVMTSWPETDCAELARLLTKFTEPLKAPELSLRRHGAPKERGS
jgi:DNA-binding MarR family transcriptional regulator